MAEEVLRDGYYCLTRNQLNSYKEYTFKKRLLRTFIGIRPVYNIYLSLLNNHGINWPFLEYQRRVRSKNYQKLCEVEQQNAHELTSEEEIESIISRIRNALESELGGKRNE